MYVTVLVFDEENLAPEILWDRDATSDGSYRVQTERPLLAPPL